MGSFTAHRNTLVPTQSLMDDSEALHLSAVQMTDLFYNYLVIL